MRKILFIILLGLIFGGIVSVRQLMSAPDKAGEARTFEIMRGQDVNAISKNLKQQGLIRSMFAFEMLIWAQRAESRVKAGAYELSPSYDLRTVVAILLGGKGRQDVRLTFIEGWHLGEYKTYLEKQGFNTDDFDRMVTDTAQWRGRYPILQSIPDGQSLEGYVFPDTYLVNVDRSVEEVLHKALRNFSVKISSSASDQSRSQEHNLHDVITLASIIEKEVARTDDRRRVADIFARRLKIGMALQSDATINYLTKSGRTRSTSEDLAIDSPYNTYKYRGLPPGPIGNPGLESIAAVLSPLPNEYLFFLTEVDGTVHYARTYEEHRRNIKMYLDNER